MDGPRRETAAARRLGTGADPVRSTTNGHPPYDGRILAAPWPPFMARIEGSRGAQEGAVVPSAPDVAPPEAPSPFTSPALVIVAALGVMEGYRQFHLIPTAHLRIPDSAFAVAAPLVAVLLARSARGWHRTAAQRALLAVAVLIGVATPLALAFGRSDAGLLLGIGDLAVALFALWAVLAGERWISWSVPDPPPDRR